MKGAPRLPSRWLPGGLPKEGKLTFAKTIAEAVADADFIQESVPERLDLKHKRAGRDRRPCAGQRALIGSVHLRHQADRHAGGDESIRSGWSSAIQFNPVYLPLVEIVGGEQTFPKAIEVARARSTPRSA